MRHILVLTISTSLFACQDTVPSASSDFDSEQILAPNFGIAKIDTMDQDYSYDRSELPFDAYLQDALEEINQYEIERPNFSDEFDGCIFAGNVQGDLNRLQVGKTFWSVELLNDDGLQLSEWDSQSLLISTIGAEQIQVAESNHSLDITMEYEVVDVELELSIIDTTIDQGKLDGVWYVCSK